MLPLLRMSPTKGRRAAFGSSVRNLDLERGYSYKDETIVNVNAVRFYGLGGLGQSFQTRL